MTTINTLIKEGKTKDMKNVTSPFIKTSDVRFNSEPINIGGDGFLYSDEEKTWEEKELAGLNNKQATIESVCDGLKEFLLAKNKNYGNSATEPVRVFSKCNANEGILVRMDDKLSRIKNSDRPAFNDTVDLLGYLVLLCKSNGWDNFKGMID